MAIGVQSTYLFEVYTYEATSNGPQKLWPHLEFYYTLIYTIAKDFGGSVYPWASIPIVQHKPTTCGYSSHLWPALHDGDWGWHGGLLYQAYFIPIPILMDGSEIGELGVWETWLILLSRDLILISGTLSSPSYFLCMKYLLPTWFYLFCGIILFGLYF